MSFWARGRHVVSNFTVVNMLKLLLCFGDFVQIGEKINFSFSSIIINLIDYTELNTESPNMKRALKKF